MVWALEGRFLLETSGYKKVFFSGKLRWLTSQEAFINHLTKLFFSAPFLRKIFRAKQFSVINHGLGTSLAIGDKDIPGVEAYSCIILKCLIFSENGAIPVCLPLVKELQ